MSGTILGDVGSKNNEITYKKKLFDFSIYDFDPTICKIIKKLNFLHES